MTTGQKARTANIGLAIWRLMCFYETFVQGSTAVILLNFVLKIRHIAKPKNVGGHPKPATVHNSTDGQMNRQANASAKSKELQPNAQSQRFAAHLLLPQPHNPKSTNKF